MASYTIPSFRRPSERVIAKSPWYADTVAGLARQVRPIAMLGLSAVLHVATDRAVTVDPGGLQKHVLLEPTNGGRLKFAADINHVLNAIPPKSPRRQQMRGGLVMLMAAFGMSAIIKHPHAESNQASTQIQLIIPEENRTAVSEYLHVPDQGVLLNGSRPARMAVLWHKNGSGFVPDISVAIRQESLSDTGVGDLTVMRIRETRYDPVGIVVSATDIQGDFPVERGAISPWVVYNLGNALLTAAHITDRSPET